LAQEGAVLCHVKELYKEIPAIIIYLAALCLYIRP
jgi:hypothetical protein